MSASLRSRAVAEARDAVVECRPESDDPAYAIQRLRGAIAGLLPRDDAHDPPPKITSEPTGPDGPPVGVIGAKYVQVRPPYWKKLLAGPVWCADRGSWVWVVRVWHGGVEILRAEDLGEPIELPDLAAHPTQTEDET